MSSERRFANGDEYIIAEHARWFILTLSKEFDKELFVVLNGAPYFRGSKITDLEERDDLEFVRLPSYSPELNPVEGWWRQLKAPFKDRFFENLPELKRAIRSGFNEISTHNTSNYL